MSLLGAPRVLLLISTKVRQILCDPHFCLGIEASNFCKTLQLKAPFMNRKEQNVFMQCLVRVGLDWEAMKQPFIVVETLTLVSDTCLIELVRTV